ncbi:MAG: S41 family peptidase, partial [Candidatus Latescibacteria bacterium]|nr:S41 family peptidase [Candidatus Latescibacterota bacterium]
MVLRMLIGFLVFCGSVSADADVPKPTERQQMDALVELMRHVRQNYYEDTEAVELLHGAIEGYLSQLDPHSTYVRPDELHDTQERLRGSFEGIGIFFEMVDDVLTVLSPIEGSPAYRAGLLPGDQIYRIDGKRALRLKSKDVTDLLKGKKGTQVVVSVRREGEQDLIDFAIVRDKIQVPSVPYAFKLTNDIGYVKVTRFSGRTGEELEGAIGDLLLQGSQKLILDLRGNGGGYLEQAVVVANQFIEKGRRLVYTEGRYRKSRENHLGRRDPIFAPDLPLIVLVDRFSASASEIVAGAIQDYDRGLVVGHTTFGKGLVQKQFYLKNQGAVLLTIARYFTPSGRPIQRPFSEDREAYQKEGYDDYDPNVDPDSLATKKVYHTRILKRKVFGGGGITPDVPVRVDTLVSFARVLIKPKNFSTFLSYAKRKEAHILQQYSDFDSFFQSYKPSSRELAEFRSLLNERDVPFTESEFQEAVPFIQKQIKQQ